MGMVTQGARFDSGLPLNIILYRNYVREQIDKT